MGTSERVALIGAAGLIIAAVISGWFLLESQKQATQGQIQLERSRDARLQLVQYDLAEEGPYIRGSAVFRNIGDRISAVTTITYSVHGAWFLQNPGCAESNLGPVPHTSLLIDVYKVGVLPPIIGSWDVPADAVRRVEFNLSTNSYNPTILPILAIGGNITHDDGRLLELSPVLLLARPYGFSVRPYYEAKCAYLSSLDEDTISFQNRQRVREMLDTGLQPSRALEAFIAPLRT